MEDQRVGAATSTNLNFQGRLFNNAGNLVPDGYYNLEFKLYSSLSGGASAQGVCVGGVTDNCLWSETYYDSNGVSAGNDNRVRVVNGYFSVNLGSLDSLADEGINWDQNLWLSMNVGGNAHTATPTFDGEMSPRTKLTAVPFALASQNVYSGDQTTNSTNSENVSVRTGNTAGTTSNTGSITVQTGNATSGNSGNIVLDVGTASGTAGTISIGSANTAGVSIGRVGVLTDITGNLRVNGSQFTNNGSTLNGVNSYGNQDFTGSGNIGYLGGSNNPTTNVDVDTAFAVAQTTPNQLISLPEPTDSTPGRIVYVLNTGTVDFTMQGITIPYGYGQLYIWNGTAWRLAASGGGAAINLQSAYDSGNSINTTNARNIYFGLSDTATDSDFVVNIANGSTGQLRVQNNGSDILSVGSSGQLQLSAQGSAGGILIGQDALIYRNAQDSLQTESFVVGNTFYTLRGSDFTTTAMNDFNFGNSSLVRLTGGSTQTLSGIANGSDGRILTIVNAGSQVAFIANDSGLSSTASNRILTGTGGQLAVPAGSSVILIYDSGASRWRIIGSAAVSSSGAGAPFVQGGNSFGVDAEIGTNDGNNLIFRTNNTNKARITTAGDLEFLQASTIQTNTGSLTIDSASVLNLGTSDATSLSLGKTGTTTTVNGGFAVTQTSTFTGASTFNGGVTVANNSNFSQTGTGTFSTGTGAVTLNGATTIANNNNFTIGTGAQFTNGSSTVLSSIAIADHATGGDIGTAVTTVDIATTFDITQTTASQTLSLPTPTSGASGRIAYVNSLTGNVSFIMHGVTIAPGSSAAFIYNGTAWVATSTGGSGVNTIGAVDTVPTATNGARISGTALYLQHADATYAGLVSATTQTIAGAKTLTGALTVTNTADININSTTALQVRNGATAVLTVDTTNGRVAIGNASPANGVLTVGTNTTAASGGIYFGTDTTLYRSGANALTTGGAFTSTGLLTASNGLTLTTGALNLTATSGALSLSGLGASSINTGANALTITSSNFNTTSTGINSTAIGATTRSTGAFTTLGANGATTLSAGATISGATTSINASSNFNTDINTGTSTGTVAIGNSASTTNILGATNINTSGSATTTLGGATSSVLLQGQTDIAAATSFATRQAVATYTTPGSANDVAISTASLYILDTSATAQIITGIASGRDGQHLTLVNADTALAVTLSNQSGSSTAANRIITGTGADVTIPAGASINLIYDATTARWRVVGAAATSTTGTGAVFLQGGNSFGVEADLGTNDNFALNLRTNGTTKAQLTTAGDLLFQQASTIRTSGATALTVDTGGAAVLNLGTTNASSVSLGRTGVLTTNNGSFTSTQTLTASNGLTLTTGALNLTATSGALSLSGLGASSINTGANALTITSSNFNTTSTGINSTAIGATTRSTGAFTTLQANALITGTLGATVTGATVNLNASSNFATNINTGTSTGAVNIGNGSAGAIAIQSSSTIGITSGTTLSLSSTGSNAINITPGGGTNTGVLVKPAVDSTSTFAVQNTAGTSNALTVDTTNVRVGIGTATPASKLDIVVNANSNQGMTINNSSSGSSATALLTLASAGGNGGLFYASSGFSAYGGANSLNIYNNSATGSIGLFTNGSNPSLLIASNGASTFRNGTNTTSAFRVQNASSQNVLVVDTSNQRVAVGPAAVPASGVLTIGTDTTTASGGIYFGTDRTLHRTATGISTNNGFTAGTNILANSATPSASVGIGAYGPSLEAGIIFGSGADTNLYRSGANILATDDSFTLFGTSSNLTVQGTGTSSFAGNLTIGGTLGVTGTSTFTGASTFNGGVTVANNSNFSQTGTGTFSTGTGAVTLNGTTTLNGNTSVSGTNTFNVGTGATTLGGTLDVTGNTTITGTLATKKGTDYSTVGTTNDVAFGSVSLVRLTGASAQTITGIAGGTDGRILAIVNAASQNATISNDSVSSIASNRITTGTGADILLTPGASMTLIYDSGASLWRTTGSVAATGGSGVNTIGAVDTVPTATNGARISGTALYLQHADATYAGLVSATTQTIAGAKTLTGALTVTNTADININSTTALQVRNGATAVLTVDTTNGRVAIGNASPANGVLTVGTNTTAASGGIYFGTDTNLYRVSGAVLATDGALASYQGSANQVTLGRTASGVPGAGITFGSAMDTNLYRSGANILATDDSFTLFGTSSNLTVQGTGTSSFAGNLTIGGTLGVTGTSTFTGASTFNGGVTVANNSNFSQTGTGTFSTGTGAVTLNGTTTLNGNTSVSGTNTFNVGTGLATFGGNLTVTSGATTLGGSLGVTGTSDFTGSIAVKAGANFSATGQTNNASFADASLIRLTGVSAQTITGIAGGRDGRLLTLVNAGANASTITNADTNSDADKRIVTGTGANIVLQPGSAITLIYDATDGFWRVSGSTAVNNAGTGAYILQGGNSFSSDVKIGTNDSNNLIFRTNNSDKAQITTTGDFEFLGASTIQTNTGALTIDSADVLNLGTSDATSIAIGRSGLGAITIDSGAGISIDGASDSNLTVTGSGQSLTLSALGGGAQQVIMQSAGTGANAIRIQANDASGGIDIDAGTNGITVDTTGAIALTSGTTLTLTSGGTDNIILNSAGIIELQDNTNVTGDLATSGDLAVNGGDITSTASTINLFNGVNPSTVNFGTSANDRTINIGTGAAVQTIAIGSTNSTSGTTINGGSNGVQVNLSAAVGSEFAIKYSGNRLFTADSDTQTVGIGSGGVDSSTTLFVQTNGADKGLRVYAPGGGNLLQLDNNTTTAFNVANNGDTTTAGDLAVNGGDITSSSATVNLFNGSTSSTINFGTSDDARTVNIATGGASQAVTIGSTNTTSSTTINGGSSGSINLGSIGLSTLGSTIHIADTTNGTGTQLVTVGSGANASNAVTLQAGATGGINLNSATINSNASTLELFGTPSTINFGGVAATFNIGPAGSTATSINLAGGSLDTGCTVDGATGNFSCSGAISSTATSGTQGWWTRSGSILQPVNAGDAITTSGNLSTSGSGTITSAGILNANATGKTAITVADSGTQNSGITIGGDTNLYRSTADTLRTDDSLSVALNLAVTGSSTLTGNVAVGTTVNTDHKLTVTSSTTDPSTSQRGISTTLNVAQTAGNANTQYGISGNLSLTGTSGNTGILSAINGLTTYNNTGTGTNVNGGTFYVNQAASGGGISSAARALYARVDNNSTNAIVNAYGLQVANNTGTGTITNQTGLHVASLTGTGNVYGVQIDTPSGGTTNAALYLSGTGGTSASGIRFGTDTNLYRSAASVLHTTASFSALRFNANPTLAANTILNSTVTGDSVARFRVFGDGRMEWGTGTANDTNLYRSTNDTLQTDDALIVAGLLTGQAGSTISGGAINLNASSNFATNINTGTSTGAVSIGNSSNSANTLNLEAGTGASAIQIGNGATAHGIQIGTGAAAQTIAIGSTTAGSTTLIQGATSVSINGAASTNITLGSSLVGGAVTIGGTTQTGNIDIGTGTGAQSINLGTGAGAKAVTIGSTNSTSATILQGGTSSGTATGGTSVRADGTASFRIQSANGSTTIFNADVTNTRITIGAPGTAQLANNLFVGIAEVSSQIRVGGSTNYIQTNGSGQLRRFGSARETKQATLVPEYQGATLTGTGIGTMTSDFCSGSSKKSVNTSICASTVEHNYYSWTTNQATNQDYSIYIRYQIPSDFDDNDSASAVWSAFGWRTDSSNSATVSIFDFDDTSTPCGTGTNVANGSDGQWNTSPQTITTSSCDFNANDIITVRITLSASLTEYVRVGEILFNYRSIF